MAAMATSDVASMYPAHLSRGPATEIDTLPNGLRVASEGGHGETATVGVWIDSGSRYETKANNGVAHFLEHLTFKGTTKRSQSQLEVEIENMGGHLNAYTSREQTVYYAKVFKDDAERAVEVLADILLHSKLEDAAINRERDVILREMQEVQSQTEEVIFDCLHETAYEQSGLGFTILGPKENIRALQRDDLMEYITTHYTGPRMVVAGAGAIDQQQLVEIAGRHFGGLADAPPRGFHVPEDSAVFTSSEQRYPDAQMPTAHVAVTFEAASWTSEHAWDLMVLQTMIGMWDRKSGGGASSAAMTSTLSKASAERNLCHSFMSFNTCYQDSGLFGVYAVAEPETLSDMMAATMESFALLHSVVSTEEVESAKSQLKALMMVQLDGSSPVCEEIGRHVLVYNRRISPLEFIAKIDEIDAEGVRACAEHFLKNRDVAITAIGPIENLQSLEWFNEATRR
jgi:processing peptidase subunit beta